MELPWCYCYLKCQYFKKKGSGEERFQLPPPRLLPIRPRVHLEALCLHSPPWEQTAGFTLQHTFYTSSFKEKLLRWVNQGIGADSKERWEVSHRDLSGIHGHCAERRTHRDWNSGSYQKPRGVPDPRGSAAWIGSWAPPIGESANSLPMGYYGMKLGPFPDSYVAVLSPSNSQNMTLFRERTLKRWTKWTWGH